MKAIVWIFLWISLNLVFLGGYLFKTDKSETIAEQLKIVLPKEKIK